MVGINSSMAPERSCSSRTMAQIFCKRAEAERQEGVNAGGLLADHAGTQHQPVRSDFRFFRRFTQNRQEVAGAGA